MWLNHAKRITDGWLDEHDVSRRAEEQQQQQRDRRKHTSQSSLTCSFLHIRVVIHFQLPPCPFLNCLDLNSTWTRGLPRLPCSDPLECLLRSALWVAGVTGREGGSGRGFKLALLVCGFYYIMLVSNGLSPVTSLTVASSASCQLAPGLLHCLPLPPC